MRHVGLVLVLGLSATAACTKVASTDLKTSGMSASMNVTADGTGKSTANAQLFVGDSLVDRVDLVGGDTLTATAGNQTQTLQRTNVLNVVTYSADFQGADQEGTKYTIAFTRASDTNAPNSIATMPAPFSILTPAASASFSRAGDDITITYAGGTSDKMSWLASGCIQTVGTQYLTGDPGTFTITKGTLKPDAQSAMATCNVTITLYRTRSGQLDPAYGHGGSIFAQQTRTLTISSKP
jgi:hypothetical protein